jgi:neutral ceramidase
MASSTVLTAGAAVADITPPLQAGLLTSSVEGRWAPFESVRLPLQARALVLGEGAGRIALVTLDLLALHDTAVGGWEAFKRALSDTIPPERIILTCTHTHTAPESMGLTDLYKTEPFLAWLEQLKSGIAKAVREAAGRTSPCTVHYGATELPGYSLQRRISTPEGIIMSDSVQPIAPELMEREPVDRRVRALWLRNSDGEAVATIVHAVCHPVHEMCLPQVSPDFPGELCAALDDTPGYGLILFLNGAAGDINPTTVSCGADTAREHGRAMAGAVREAAPHRKASGASSFTYARREVELPMRSLTGKPIRKTCTARLSAVRIGDLALVFLPAEPFVETGLAIERASPFANTIVTGYAENSVGYMPPEQAMKEGGYEAGPGKWSFLQPGAEAMIRETAAVILKALA